MNCARCQSLISPLLDGEIAAAEATAIESHLVSCDGCRRARDEMAAMIAATRSLAVATPEPHPALWTRIEAGLDAPPQRRFRWWYALAPMVAATAIAAGWIALRRLPPSDDALLADAATEFAKAERHYARALADLRTVCTRERDRWPEDRRRAFDDAARAHDQAVEKSRAQARSAPHDPEAQALLYGAYRRQIGFLQDSLLRSAAVDR